MTKHKFSKILKIISIFIVLLFIVLFGIEKIFRHIYSLPKHDEKEIQNFLQFKDDAEAVNGYMIEKFVNKAYSDNDVVFVVQKDGKVIGLHDSEYLEIPERLTNSFDSIRNGMNQSDTDFFIEITKDRISYGGLSHYMYVYSRNGKAPAFYYHKGDGMHPEVFDLGNNWYLLKVNFR